MNRTDSADRTRPPQYRPHVPAFPASRHPARPQLTLRPDLIAAARIRRAQSKRGRSQSPAAIGTWL